MFFILSKTVTPLLSPSNLFFTIGLVGTVLMATRCRRAGAQLAAASILLLGAAGYLPVAQVLIHPLENRFPPWDPSRGAPDGIVVLGGVIAPDLTLDRGSPAVPRAAGRLIALVKLARQFPRARIIYSSGNASLVPGGLAEADVLYRVLDDFGVPRQRVILERRARNTAENAIFSKAIAKAQARRALAAGHLGRAHAARRRMLPPRRFSSRSLSGRLDHLQTPVPRSLAVAERWPETHRFCRSRVGWTLGLLADGADQRTPARAGRSQNDCQELVPAKTVAIFWSYAGSKSLHTALYLKGIGTRRHRLKSELCCLRSSWYYF